MKEMTCIVCPRGCNLHVQENADSKISVSGNHCPRGEKYAISEIISPSRNITTTIICKNGELLSVKTDRPIPKDKMFECIKNINSITINPPVKIGDVIAENVFGANIVATKNIN